MEARCEGRPGPDRGRCWYAALALALALALLVGACDGPNDQVVLSNGSGEDHGLLVDGQEGDVSRSDARFTSPEPILDVGQFSASPVNNEVFAFTNFRPVAVATPVAWTDGADTVELPLEDEIAIPVTAWIVQGPFEDQRDRAIDACVTTALVWNAERMGVRFDPFDIRDATADPQAERFLEFTCDDREALQAAIGADPGRINIYFVETVDGGTGRGQACGIGSDFVAMGHTAGDDLLVHELGHDFALDHVDAFEDFDNANVLFSASGVRQFFSEGQLVRAHLSPASALNAVYDARPGQITRLCPDLGETPQCPRLGKRVWADGAFFPD